MIYKSEFEEKFLHFDVEVMLREPVHEFLHVVKELLHCLGEDD